MSRTRQKIIEKEDGQGISSSLSENLNCLQEVFSFDSDFIVRRICLGRGKGVPAALVYLESLTDHKIINEQVLKPLFFGIPDRVWKPDAFLRFVREQVLAVEQVTQFRQMTDVIDYLPRGWSVVFLEGATEALGCFTPGWERRSITESQAEGLVRGPREAFIEDLNVNISLIRRRLKTPCLKIETFLLGRLTQTKVILVYLQGIASEKVLKEVRGRVSRIDVDGVYDSGAVEELIEDCPLSPFAQIFSTERPDVVVANLLEGRIAILVDGSPIALVVPALFVQFFQAAEDYYERYPVAAGVRILRLIALLILLTLPSAYVAVTTFHQELFPTPLLLNVMASREGVPFPSLAEALMMEFVFEALREAGLRLPRPVGQAVSIVGGLVLGQAAISATLVSPLMVIVVALTGIASFLLPAYAMGITLRLIRFPILILAGVLGFFGLAAGLLGVMIHLTTLRSFGVPYLVPLTPSVIGGLKDVFIRAPYWVLDRRPALIGSGNQVRQAQGQKPEPPPSRLRRGGKRDARRR